MNQKIIMHIDMNSYFASVEQQANPFLRGKSLGVCAYLSANGCIIASSIEAKAKGVTTGMRVFDAKKLDPNIILVENEPAKYRSTTERIFAILSDYTDKLEPYSIDEAFLDLTGWANKPSPDLRPPSPKGRGINSSPLPLGEGPGERSFQGAYNIAQEIRARITTEVGEWLKSSVGISYTRFLAKFASDIADKNSILTLNKDASDIADKNSILTLNKDALDATLKQRKLTDAWGINFRLARRLNWLNIFTLYDLKQYPVSNLMTIFGKPGYYMWANVNGIEIASKTTPIISQPKSFGHSYCLPKKTTDRKYLRSILMKLCERAGRRLRNKQFEAKNLGAFIAFVNGGGHGGDYKTTQPLFDTVSIYNHAERILFFNPLPDRVRMIALRVSNLIPLQSQQSLFEDALKPKKIARACDTINNKYGEFVLYPGQMINMQGFAHDRVGYRMTVDVPDRIDSVEEYEDMDEY